MNDAINGTQIPQCSAYQKTITAVVEIRENHISSNISIIPDGGTQLPLDLLNIFRNIPIFVEVTRMNKDGNLDYCFNLKLEYCDHDIDWFIHNVIRQYLFNYGFSMVLRTNNAT